MAACSTTRRNSSERSESISTFLFRLVRRQFTPRRAIGAITQQVIGLHQLVNFARALVDDRALAVPVEPAHRVLVGVAVRAVNPVSYTHLTLPTNRKV